MSYTKPLYMVLRNVIENCFIEKFGFLLLINVLEIAGLILFLLMHFSTEYLMLNFCLLTIIVLLILIRAKTTKLVKGTDAYFENRMLFLIVFSLVDFFFLSDFMDVIGIPNTLNKGILPILCLGGTTIIACLSSKLFYLLDLYLNKTTENYKIHKSSIITLSITILAFLVLFVYIMVIFYKQPFIIILLDLFLSLILAIAIIAYNGPKYWDFVYFPIKLF